MRANNHTDVLTDPGDVVAVRHLRVAGSHFEIGRAMAAAAEQAHGTLAAPQAIDPTLERVRRRWFALHHPALAERSRGVAAHLGIDPDDPTVALDWLGTYALPAGCSVAFYPGAGTKGGHGILARNFDFPTTTLSGLFGLASTPDERPLGADPWIVETYPDHGYASVTIGIMDVMGAMDGINDAGLAVALLADNETPEPEPTGAPNVGLAEQQVVRYLLDTCATVDDAIAALRLAKHYYFFTPCHYMIADRSGRAIVWEHSPRRNQERIIEQDNTATGRLVCTNHLLHRWPDPTQLPDDTGPNGTAALTYHRWRTLTDANANGAVVDAATIDEQFASVRFTAPIVEARTFWHATYDVDDSNATMSFWLRDTDTTSIYSDPLTIRLQR